MNLNENIQGFHKKNIQGLFLQFKLHIYVCYVSLFNWFDFLKSDT